MLPKKNRADKGAVDEIFKEGRFFNSPNLTFKFTLKNTTPFPRISFIVPKSVAKKAVDRNKLRRLGYSVLEKYIKKISPQIVGALVFKKYQEDSSIIENEIKDLFHKID
jgi:ribonuclease P protein component